MRIPGLLAITGLVLACAGCGSGEPAGGSAQGSGVPAASAPATASGSALKGRLFGRLRLDGLAQPLLLTRQREASDGFQMLVYVGNGSGAAATELTDASGNPVVPFVATGTRPKQFVSVTCAGGGLQVEVATQTQPRGMLSAWDIDRTSYLVDRSGAQSTGQERVATSVPDRSLRNDWPALFHQRLFVGCRKFSGPVAQ